MLIKKGGFDFSDKYVDIPHEQLDYMIRSKTNIRFNMSLQFFERDPKKGPHFTIYDTTPKKDPKGVRKLSIQLNGESAIKVEQNLVSLMISLVPLEKHPHFNDLYLNVNENIPGRIALNLENPHDEDELDEMMMKASDAFNNGEFEKALEMYKTILKVDPQVPQALYYLGFSFYWLKKYRKSIKHYKNALTIDPSNAPKYYEAIFNALFSLNKFRRLQSIWKKLINEGPNDPDYLYLGGIVFHSTCEFNKAIELYLKSNLIRAEPKINSFLRLAVAYISNYEYEKAMNLIDSGFAQFKDNLALTIYKGMVFLNKGLLDQIILLLKKFKDNQPYFKRFQINTLLGPYYLEKGQYYRAKIAYRKCNRTLNLNLIYIRRENFPKAISLLKKEIRESNRDANTWQYLASCYAEINDFDKARRAINIAMALNPYSYDIRIIDAKVYLKNKQYEKALSICNTVLEKIPNHIHGLYYKGIIYFEKEKLEESKIIFKKILTIKKSDDEAKIYLTRIYYKQQKYEDALRLIRNRTNPYSRDFFYLAVKIIDEINKLSGSAN